MRNELVQIEESSKAIELTPGNNSFKVTEVDTSQIHNTASHITIIHHILEGTEIDLNDIIDNIFENYLKGIDSSTGNLSFFYVFHEVPKNSFYSTEQVHNNFEKNFPSLNSDNLKHEFDNTVIINIIETGEATSHSMDVFPYLLRKHIWGFQNHATQIRAFEIKDIANYIDSDNLSQQGKELLLTRPEFVNELNAPRLKNQEQLDFSTDSTFYAPHFRSESEELIAKIDGRSLLFCDANGDSEGKDRATEILYCYRKEAFLSKTRGYSEIKESYSKAIFLSDTMFTKECFYKHLKDPEIKYVSITGHGSRYTHTFYGYNYQAILWPELVNQSPELVSGKIFHLVGCHHGAPGGLAQLMVEHGAKAVIAFDHQYKIIDSDMAPYYKSLVGISTEVDKELIRGRTVGQAVCSAWSRYSAWEKKSGEQGSIESTKLVKDIMGRIIVWGDLSAKLSSAPLSPQSGMDSVARCWKPSAERAMEAVGGGEQAPSRQRCFR